MAASPSALQNKQNIASRNDDELRASKPCCLVLLSGLPGSGKSLIAQLIMDRSELLLEALNQAFEKPQKSAYFSSISVQIVSYDHFLNQQLIDSPTAAFSPDLWHQSRELALNRVRERAAAASSSTSTSIYHVIVIDDNMNYRSMRRQVFQVAHERMLFQNSRLDFCSSPCVLTWWYFPKYSVSELSLCSSRGKIRSISVFGPQHET